MNVPTSLLFGLDGFAVLDVARVEHGTVRVVTATVSREAGWLDCGVLSARVKERPMSRIRDLPASGQRVELWWRERRLLGVESGCSRGSFAERRDEVGFWSRLTARLRDRLATAIAGSNRAVSDVATAHGVGWHTAHSALIKAAARWLPDPKPTRVLGIDQTRARSVRWILKDEVRRVWRRSDPWMTSFVNADTADPDRPGSLLGLAPGRSSACVKTWLDEQFEAFRDGIEVAVIDPSAPYPSGIRKALPNALIAVDHWHLVGSPTRP
jgi:transposase